MAVDRFSDEYKLQWALLKAGGLKGAAASQAFKTALEETGPALGGATALDEFRKAAAKDGEAKVLMEGADIAADATTALTKAELDKAALLKFLRHLYLAGARGSQSVWVFSSPLAYRKFPSEEVAENGATRTKLKETLNDVAEVFSDETKSRLSEAIQLALTWSLAAQTTLSTAATDANAMKKVKQWFAGAGTSASTLTTTIADLLAGFKKVTSTLNGNSLIISDMPKDRANPKKELTEAYVFNAKESPKTTYVEKAFFENYDVSVLHDMKKNWARVLLHEVTHIDVSTVDNAYAWAGIGVDTCLTDAQAAVNADSWAFFAADCGNALTAGEITRALGGTKGNLTKHPKNWN